MTDLSLAAKGRNEPRAGLLEEGKVHVQLGRELAAPLEKFGYPRASTDLLESEIRARFNKDLLLRARKQRPTKGEKGAGE